MRVWHGLDIECLLWILARDVIVRSSNWNLDPMARKAVVCENYDAKSGSTIVTMHKDYLATLSVGTHALTFTDGTCSTGLTIKPTGSTVEVTVSRENTTTPGNTSNPGSGANDAVDIVTVLAVASCIAISRKKRIEPISY